MNNPLPRGNSVLAKMIAARNARLSGLETVGATPAIEEAANKIVERVLAESKDVLPQEPVDTTPKFNPFDKPKSAPVATLTNETSNVTSFVLPPENEAGLVNPNIELDESQKEAIEIIKNEQYACLIGAAGTGKTTVQKYLIREILYGKESTFKIRGIPGSARCNIAFAAFTGQAVQVIKKNLPPWLHANCHTIHGLLEFEPDREQSDDGESKRMFKPKRNNLFKLNESLIILDEASMIGMDLWIQLIDACRRGTRIIMTGDLNQLPPIIGQPIFAYALANWKVAELKTVHRQKGEGANRIIDIAHEVLNGKVPQFDDSKTNKDWRVLFGNIDKNPEKARREILSTLMALRNKKVVGETGELRGVYEPHLDRVMTAGNGYEGDKTSDAVQQAPLNNDLAILIDPPTPEHPRLIIDAGRSWKKFAMHNRVMATKNEAPNKMNRVTNGQAGTIIDLVPNPRYTGDKGKVGAEEDVKEYRKQLLSGGFDSDLDLESMSALTIEEGDLDYDTESAEMEAEGGGAASHIVRVQFDNGAEREYSSKAQVDGIQLAYCSTVAKCQGSQFETAIIICHHAQKSQLSREWLYTAITRASQRVIVLGTDYAIRYAISRQKISGNTIAEKVERYRALMNEGISNSFGVTVRMNVPVTIEDYFDRNYLYIGGK